MNEEQACKTLADVIAKSAAAQGKVIEVGWLAMRRLIIPADASETQVKEMRKAFYLGADHLFASIMAVLDPQADPTEKDLKVMDGIWKEIEAFRKEVTARP